MKCGDRATQKVSLSQINTERKQTSPVQSRESAVGTARKL